MKTILSLIALLVLTTSARGQSGTLIVLNKSDHTASLIDLASKEIRATIPTGVGPHEVAVSPDGKRAVVANYGTGTNPSSSLTVIGIPERSKLKEIDLGEYRRPHDIAWLQNDDVAVTVEGSRALILVDVGRGTVRDAIDTDQNISHMVVVTPQGNRAFVANIGSGSVTVLDLANRKRLANITTGAGAEGIDITPNGLSRNDIINS